MANLAVYNPEQPQGIKVVQWFKRQGEESPWRLEQWIDIPEEYMDRLEEITGDGKASLTLGMEMKTTLDYNTAGSTCYVKLTCGQSEELLDAAADLANELAEKYVAQGHRTACDLLNRTLGLAPQEPPSAKREHVVAKPRKANILKAKKPKAQQKTPLKVGGPKGKGRPTFRR